MARNNKLDIPLFPPVYVPFQPPKAVRPGRDYDKVEWGGLRLEPLGVRTEELLSLRMMEAGIRAQTERCTRTKRSEAQTAAGTATGIPVTEGEGEGIAIGCEMQSPNGAPANGTGCSPSWHIHLLPSDTDRIPFLIDVEEPSPNTESTDTSSPPTNASLLTHPNTILHKVLLHIFHHVHLIYIFITAPFRHRYAEWDAHRGSLGSHDTHTARWLRKTRVWREFEECRPIHGNDYGNGYGFGYNRIYSNDIVAMFDEENEGGGGIGNVGGGGYGTFPVGIPTSRESMMAKGLGTVVSWGEGVSGASRQ
jgi:hypothetical protein